MNKIDQLEKNDKTKNENLYQKIQLMEDKLSEMSIKLDEEKRCAKK